MKIPYSIRFLMLAALLLGAAPLHAQIAGTSFSVVNASTTVPVALTNNTTITANSITVIGKASAQGSANVGSVYIGFHSADGANCYEITSGSYHVFTAPRGNSYRLSTFYIDVVNANDGVTVMFQP
jgi:hypothetical protein